MRYLSLDSRVLFLCVCIALVAVPVGLAANDAYEPNDDFDTAATIQPGSYGGLAVGPDDRDFYAVELEKGETLNVLVTESKENGDIPPVWIHGPDGSAVDQGYDTSEKIDDSNLVRVAHEAHENGTYYIQVGVVETSLTYSMDVSVAANDRFEPNGVTSQARSPGDGTYTGLTLLSEESDYFAVELAAGEAVNFSVSYDADVPSYPSVTLVGPDGNTVDEGVDHSDSNDDEREVRVGHEARQAGTYYVRIRGDEAYSCGLSGCAEYEEGFSYSLSLQTGANDRFESNGERGTAPSISFGTHDDLALLSEENDYFTFELEEGETVNLSVSYDENIPVYPSVTVVGPDGNTVDESVDHSDSSDGRRVDRIGYEARQAGTYYVRIRGDEAYSCGLSGCAEYEKSYSYSLSVHAGSNDQFEPNGKLDTAAAVESGFSGNLTLLSEENDYFAVEAEKGEVVNLSVSYDENIPVYPSVTVVGPDGNTVDESVDHSDSSDGRRVDRIGYEAEQTGTYYVRIRGDEAYSCGLSGCAEYEAGYTYAFDIRVGTGDQFEPNGGFDTAAMLDPGFSETLSLVSEESDYYAVQVEEGETLNLSISNDKDTITDPTIRLYTPDGYEVDSALEYSDNIDDRTDFRLVHQAEQSGTYYVVVSGTETYSCGFSGCSEYEGSYPYEMSVDVADNDRFEPNGLLTGATPISPGEYGNLSLLGGEDDHYAVRLSAGERIEIRVSNVKEAPVSPSLTLFGPGGSEVAYGSDQSDPIDDRTNYTLNHEAETAGVYYVQVSGDEGEQRASDYTLEVVGGSAPGGSPPETSVSLTPVNPEVGAEIIFDASASSDPDGDALSFAWDFDGDGTTDAMGATAAHAFETAGTHEVSLTVTDSAGQSTTVTRNVTVSEAALDVSASRSVKSTTIAPGETTTVTTTVNVGTDVSRFVLIERFDPAVADVTNAESTVTGNGTVLSTVSNTTAVTVAVENVSAGDTLTLTYTVAIDDHASVGTTRTISATAQTSVGNATLEETTLTVEKSGLSAYAGADEIIQADELQTIISDWALGKVGTSMLQKAISAWALGTAV